MSEIGMKPARERSFSIHEPMRISRAATDSFSALGHISRSCLQHKFDPTCAIPVYIYSYSATPVCGGSATSPLHTPGTMARGGENALPIAQDELRQALRSASLAKSRQKEAERVAKQELWRVPNASGSVRL